MTGQNVYDSYADPLGADAVFTSRWEDTQSFSAFSAMLTGDEVIESARFEWSNDAATVRFVQPWVTGENPVSYGGTMGAATPTQSKYVRVVVENGSNAQGPTWLVQTTLLTETPSGYVSPLIDYPEDSDPGQTVKAILIGRRIGDVDPQYTHVLLDDGGELITSAGPLPTTNFGQRIPATLDSTLVTSITPEERSSLSIFNSSTAGNMYVRLAADVDIAENDWDYKVLPGWLWVAPKWGGDVYIAWDSDADGFGHAQEVTGNS